MPILQNTEVVKILIKRGPEANLPTLDIGELAFTTDTNRYFVGSEIGNYELGSMDDIDSVLVELEALGLKLSKQDLRTATLTGGVQVLEADQAGPLSVNFVGRTLTSLGNSNLEASKYYTLTDEKTKIVVDKQTVAGVGKFQKAQTTKTVADFAGKVRGNTSINPHIPKVKLTASSAVGLLTPDEFVWDSIPHQYVVVLDGLVYDLPSNPANTQAQILFSFNVVEQVERELGIIPRESLEGKIQWAKDNISQLTADWYGFGSSASGNSSTFSVWNGTSWVAPVTKTTSTVERVRVINDSSVMPYRFDTAGFVHFLAYAEPSDGTTPSVISTDYVSLDIELKSTAQLNTRGKVIRVENFEGKVSGSTVENPHSMKSTGGNSPLTYLLDPYDSKWVNRDSFSETVARVDGLVFSNGTSVNEAIAQNIFSFNLTEVVERNIGKIPASSIAGKVTWIRNNLDTVTGNWHGHGSSPNGSGATFAIFDGAYGSRQSHTSSTPTKLSRQSITSSHSHRIRDDGFIHFIAYADPSDGVTISGINTDYIELVIELKPDADFHAPKVPLYEVTKEEYDKIGLQWDATEVKRRFPIVEGTQHLTNPYVTVEGDNLFPPFTQWTLHSSAIVDSPYELSLPAYNGTTVNLFGVWLKKGTAFNISFEGDPGALYRIIRYDDGTNSGSNILNTNYYPAPSSVMEKDGFFEVQFRGDRTAARTIKNPMFTLGTKPKNFVPRNPSYLYAEAALGAIGDKKDTLFKEDGKWKVQKNVESIELDGSLDWTYTNEIGDIKSFKVPSIPRQLNTFTTANSKVIEYDGTSLGTILIAVQDSAGFRQRTSDSFFYLNIRNSRTGLDEGPTLMAHIKRYFNGWKYSDGVTWTSVTGNGQTATAQEALDTKPTGYTPYKLSYTPTNPIAHEVYVEGDISIQGDAQISVSEGIVVREKMTFVKAGVQYYSNTLTPGFVDTLYDHPTKEIIGFYAGTSTENLYRKIDKVDDNLIMTNGKKRIVITEENFDLNTDYYVTYAVLDKHRFTVNVTELPVWYSQSLPSSFSAIVTGQSDVATANSLQVRAIAEMYKQLNSLG